MSCEYLSAVWKDPRITRPEDMIVVHVIADSGDMEGVYWYGQDELAAKARCKIPELHRILNRLESRGVIRIRVDHKTRKIGYQVTSPLQ